MADSCTCIVCLLDLDSLEPPLPSDAHDQGESLDSLTAPDHVRVKSESKQNDKSPLLDAELVAHLPCGHYLHNDCLKPWVERANSCPTCRASFNVVELVAKIGGPVISTYSVQDKQQVPEIDPNLIVDADFDIEEVPDDEACMMCADYTSGPGERQMLECDACERYCHMFCAALNQRPRGEWFCPDCIEHPQMIANARRQARSRLRQRTRRRRAPSRETNAWARVWQTVWHNLHFDLDYPFDDEEGAIQFQQEQEEAQRRELNEWNRRLRLASRQGAGDRFRQTAAAILQRQSPQPPAPPPNPESQEELRAWNAFEKAREAKDVPSVGNRTKRKSKSNTTSPKEPDSEPQQSERALKRPRTRRAQDALAIAGPSVAEPSTRKPPVMINHRKSPPLRLDQEAGDGRPSFLQSLLKEVEVGAKSDGAQLSPLDLVPVADLLDRASSPQASSPGASPTSSNHPTSRAGTPPPLSLARPSSPPISSTVRPIYPLAPNFSPITSSSSPDASGTERQARAHHHRQHLHQSRSLSPPRSKDASPTRISLSTKSEIQAMVRTSLDTLYHQRKVSKEQYTDINRDVSRMLYERVGEDADSLAESGRTREKWQDIAIQEVDAAVRALAETEEKEQEGDEKHRTQISRTIPLAPKSRIIMATPSWSPTLQANGEE